MNPVLGKISSVFEYVRNSDGRPTGATKDVLSTELQARIAAGVTFKVTAKVDGTCCWIHNSELMARQDIKNGRTAPTGWVATAGDEPDIGGHLIGFRPLDPKGGADKWHHQALLPDGKALFFERAESGFVEVEKSLKDYEGMTVELVGPKLQGNPHGVPKHGLIVHGSIDISSTLSDGWKNHTPLKKWLTEGAGVTYEGIVLHGSDGALYKCHRGHLGLSWK